MLERQRNGGVKNEAYEDSDSCRVTIDTMQKQEIRGPVLSFHDISYNVDTGRGVGGNKGQKNILNNLSGVMKPGLNAILGPTGSGKTTLLDVLAGRKNQTGLTGSVLLNNQTLPSNFKCLSGYVIQNDIVTPTLTVRENLWFSAHLRLPQTVSNQSKQERIDQILVDLNLTSCADTKIGNEMIRGVSGGEKKRASIGMELITAPTVLFLDEPTTGLDASTANAVMFLLKQLSQKGCTVIFSIHQPRYSIFKHFDTLTLLGEGHMVYQGPKQQVLPYFESIGYTREEHNNPADFLLDVINSDSPTFKSNGNGSNVKSEGRKSSLSEHLSSLYKESIQQDSYIKEKDVSEMKSTVNDTEYTTSTMYQFMKLFQRELVGLFRSPAAIIANVTINILSGLIFGILYFNIGMSQTIGVQNRFGVLYFMLTKAMFDNTAIADLFIKERSLFVHEYISGYYRVISYFLAKLLAVVIPLNTIGVLLTSVIAYWMVGLKADVSSFFIFFLFCLLISLSAASIVLFYSASFSNSSVASLVTTLTFVFSLLFNSLTINVGSMFKWVSWIKYLSISHYSFTGAAINEFSGLNFQAKCFPPNSTCPSVLGETIIQGRLSLNTSETIEWQLWQNVLALVCIFMGMLVLTYVQLTRTKLYT
nr:ATP-binding cassette sub-family G member 2 [Ciona intestinalis]XP_026691428.1 ATP-binding cassette sub-family G member 2 [Ciona intestinalis]|eukprot:XP_002125421.1 ATP-binding cassette sub-family G member 2 [Ciona intestinalis]